MLLNQGALAFSIGVVLNLLLHCSSTSGDGQHERVHQRHELLLGRSTLVLQSQVCLKRAVDSASSLVRSRSSRSFFSQRPNPGSWVHSSPLPCCLEPRRQITFPSAKSSLSCEAACARLPFASRLCLRLGTGGRPLQHARLSFPCQEGTRAAPASQAQNLIDPQPNADCAVH